MTPDAEVGEAGVLQLWSEKYAITTLFVEVVVVEAEVVVVFVVVEGAVVDEVAGAVVSSWNLTI
ncbi:hypothetical protein COY95_01030 [Candidatus Woesearchaeota archaeon CG_4_10_14_0_8_um_filter_47_5]|nr:MAG: hypothetical protein COY95_01030 [Candidatus Woesearchaeota archaeon CG_4_10_14_0_8_um_filter_47_5]